MEENENETVKSLRHCETILKNLLKQYEGNLFNTGGDSFLIEFPSAVGAVQCAVNFQKEIKMYIILTSPLNLIWIQKKHFSSRRCN